MTKQEEIREGIAKSIFERFTNGRKPWEKCTQKHKDIFLKRADLILTYLHSQGVVIKAKPQTYPRWIPDDEFALESEATMARVLPDIFDGSLSIDQYYHEKEKYLAFIKLIQEELDEAGYEAVEPLIKEVMPSD